MSTLSPARARHVAPSGSLGERVARWARERAGEAAVRMVGHDGGTMTYSRLWDEARRVADDLELIDARRRIAVLWASNGFSHPVYVTGALLAGAELVMAHGSLTGSEVERIALAAGASVVFRPSPDGGGILREPVRGDSGRHAAWPGAVVLQTSGTTGQARLVVRDEAALIADAAGIAGAASLTPEDRVFCAMPLSHSYGVDFTLAALYAGASMDISGGLDAARAERHFARGGSTVFPGVPFMFDALSRGCSARPATPPRLAFSAGTPLPERVRARAAERLGMAVGELYGATELGSVTLNAPGSGGYLPGCVGGAFEGVSIRVLDLADPSRVLPAGIEGQVAVRAASMLSAYADGPRELVDGHFATGDLGRLDEAGRLTITGRIRLLIDAGGLKVNPVEVESVFAAHPGVAECAALPLRLSDTVTKVRLCFVPVDAASPPSAEELRAFARSRLAAWKMPRVFEACGPLPRTASGKLLRHRIGGAV